MTRIQSSQSFVSPQECSEIKEERKMEGKKAQVHKHSRARLRISWEKVFHIPDSSIKNYESITYVMATEIASTLAESASGTEDTRKSFDECIGKMSTLSKDTPDLIIKRDGEGHNESDGYIVVAEVKREHENDLFCLERQSMEIEEMARKLGEIFNNLLSEEQEKKENKQHMAVSSLQPVLLDLSFEDDGSNLTLSELDSVIEYHGQNEFVLRIQHVISFVNYCWVSSHGDRADSVNIGFLKKGLDSNSLYNFQNCKVPPPLQQFIQNGANHESDYPSAEWRPAGGSQFTLSSESEIGGKKECRKCNVSCENVWPSWRKLLKGFREMSLSSYPYWKIFSRHTQSLSREVFQCCLRFTTACLRRITGRQPFNSSCCSRSYGPNIEENANANPSRILICGGLFF